MGWAGAFVYQRDGLPNIDIGAAPGAILATPFTTDQEAYDAAVAHSERLDATWLARYGETYCPRDGSGHLAVKQHATITDPPRWCVQNYDMEEIEPTMIAEGLQVGVYQMVGDDNGWEEPPAIRAKGSEHPPPGWAIPEQKARGLRKKTSGKPGKRPPKKK